MRKAVSVVATAVAFSASVPPTIADVVPSWRVNPFTLAALPANPELHGASSVSLVVTLTGNSLFNVAGMRIDPGELPITGYFNHPFGGDTTPYVPLPIFPGHLLRHIRRHDAGLQPTAGDSGSILGPRAARSSVTTTPSTRPGAQRATPDRRAEPIWRSPG